MYYFSNDNMKNELAELEERLGEIATQEDKFLNIVDSIFEMRSPNNTLKIGFIYLANILHYYPSLAEKYVKLLIELDYVVIRQQVLEIDNATFEMEYTGNCLAEKYKICGAPLLWMPIYLAGIFRDYIITNNIQAFSFPDITTNKVNLQPFWRGAIFMFVHTFPVNG